MFLLLSLTPILSISVSLVCTHQSLGAGSSGQPTPLLPGDLCLHCRRGEGAGSSSDPHPREATGSHPGNLSLSVRASACRRVTGCTARVC